MNTGPQTVFRALSDPTRRQILLLLREETLTLGQITNRFAITRAAVKKHLSILEEGQLIASHAQGRERLHELRPEALRSAVEWLGYFSTFWDVRLADLKNVVEADEGNKQ